MPVLKTRLWNIPHVASLYFFVFLNKIFLHEFSDYLKHELKEIAQGF